MQCLCWLGLVAVLGSPLAQATQLLPQPELTLNRDSNQEIAEDNGIAIKADNTLAFVTTRAGVLLEAPVRDPNPTIDSPFLINDFWVPPSAQRITRTTCFSSVILVQDRFAVYSVIDDERNEEGASSRIFIVDTTGQEDTRTLTVDGSAKGTPLYSPTGHLFVVHNVLNKDDERVGKLSIFDFATDQLVTTAPQNGPGTKDVVALAAPAMTTVDLGNGKVVDWVVVGEMIEGGSVTSGSLYGIRFNPSDGTALWHRLAKDFGSLIKEPAVSKDGKTIVTGGFRNTVTGWIDHADLEAAMLSDTALRLDIRPTWSTRISNRNVFIPTPPVLLQDSNLQLALTPNTNRDLFSVDLDDTGAAGRFLDTFDTHLTPPLVTRSPTGEILAVYDISVSGILRQVNPGGIVNYEANCLGYMQPDMNNPLRATRNNCNGVNANMALSPNGEFVVYAGSAGVITAFKVSDFVTEPPTASPTTSPTLSPSVSPTTSPIAAPSASPTSVPTKSPTVTDYPTYSPSSAVPTLSPVGSGNQGGDDDDDDNADPPGDDDDDDGNQGDDDDDDDNGTQGDDDDDDDNGDTNGGGGTQVDGLGGNTGVPSASSDGSNLVVIVLAVVAGALICCIMATFLLMRKNKEAKDEEAKMQEEVAAKKAWMSNKKLYEEEMRMEEEETLNALASPSEEPPPEQTVAHAKTLRTNRKRRHDRGRISSMSSLGSISESDCEEDHEYQKSSVGTESGFEIALEEMENGENSTTASTSPSGSPSRSDFSSPASLRSGTPIVGDFMPSTLASKRLTHPASSSSEAADPVIAPRSSGGAIPPSHDKWFTEVLGIRANSMKKASGTYSQKAAHSLKAAPLSPTPTAGGEDVDETTSRLSEPGRIRVPVGQDNEVGSRTPKRDTDSVDIPMRSPRNVAPRSPMSPSVLSVDSSLYLEGSTLSPAGTRSTLSPAGTNMSAGHVARRGLSPPGGGSILSGLGTANVADDDDDVEEATSKRPYDTPGSHYLMPRLGQPNQQDSVGSASPTRSPTRSPTSYHRPQMSAEEYEEIESPRGATTYSSVTPAQSSQSRAGLFSRRERPVERLLTQNDDASASDADSVEQHQQNADRYSKEKMLKQVTPSPYQVQSARRSPVTVSSTKNSNSPPKETAASQNSQTNNDSGSSTNNKSKDMWNSFLSELSKAEEQFFNPQSTRRSVTQNDTPPPPPPPEPFGTLGSYDDDDDDVPPPPPDH